MPTYIVTMTHTQGEDYRIRARNEEEAIHKVEYDGEGDQVRTKSISFEFADIEKESPTRGSSSRRSTRSSSGR